MAEENMNNLRECFIVCDLSEAQRDALTNEEGEGFTSLESFGHTTEKQISAMLKQLGARRPPADAVYFGMVATRNLNALAFWVRDMRRRNFEVEADDWTEELLSTTIEEMEFGPKENEKGNLPELSKMKVGSAFLQWTIEARNKLMSMTGVTAVPLGYIIRAPLPEDHDGEFEDDDEALLYDAPLEGRAFDYDKKTVHQLLKNAVLGTNGWAWYKKTSKGEDGRKGWLALCDHYNGPGVVETRIAEATSLIKGTHYKDEMKFPMEQVVTNLRSGYTTLRENDCPLSDREEVDKFLGKINSSHLDIRTAISQIRSTPELRQSFEAAANFMLERVAITFPDGGAERASRKRKIADVGRGGGRGRGGGKGKGRGEGRGGRGGRGRGRGGGGRGGRGGWENFQQGQDYSNQSIVNGIDISDVTRAFPANEWSALPTSCTSWIHQERARLNGQRQVGATNVATNVQWALPPMIMNPAQIAAVTAGTTMQGAVPGNAGHAFGSSSYGQAGANATAGQANV